MPKDGGGYRLYAYVYDARGNAATANVPLFVKGPAAPRPPGQGLQAPAGRLRRGGPREAARISPPATWATPRPSRSQEDCPDAPHSGKTCIRVDYQAGDGWGGVVWQSPANDWGDAPGGFDLTGAKALTFWARGAKGGEAVDF